MSNPTQSFWDKSYTDFVQKQGLELLLYLIMDRDFRQKVSQNKGNIRNLLKLNNNFQRLMDNPDTDSALDGVRNLICDSWPCPPYSA